MFELSIDYSRLTSFLLLVEFLNRIRKRFLVSVFDDSLSFRTLSQEKRHNTRPLSRRVQFLLLLYYYKFEATILLATTIHPTVTSLKRGRRILLRPWLSTGPRNGQQKSFLFWAHARKGVALLIDTWLNDHLKPGTFSPARWFTTRGVDPC